MNKKPRYIPRFMWTSGSRIRFIYRKGQPPRFRLVPRGTRLITKSSDGFMAFKQNHRNFVEKHGFQPKTHRSRTESFFTTPQGRKITVWEE